MNDAFYKNSKKYPAIQKCDGDEDHIGLVQDLGTSPADMKKAVDKMGAGGSTNITLGVAWGFAMLTKQAPFEQVTLAERTRRIMIVMTDGENRESAHSKSPSTNNTWTLEACANAKAAGIEIYTVGFIDADDKILGTCASAPANHLTAANVNEIDDVFRMLALAVRRPMLSK